MKVIDAHCDVLGKMLLNPQIDFFDETSLDVTLPRLQAGHVTLQTFAIYISGKIKNCNFDHVLQCVALFHSKILSNEGIVFVRSPQDLETARQNGRMGAMLSLEGADALRGNFTHLRMLFQLGVRSIGITWNYANWAADGVMEPRQGGLTKQGEELVRECNRMGIILDVSHLTDRGFWELTELSERPFIASHSNAFEICPHPRNLKNEQIEAIIRMGGMIGATFVPWFVHPSYPVTLPQLLTHIDHICELGGAGHLGLGSDFDGIDRWIDDLRHPGQYVNLVNALLQHYKQEEVEGFLWKNWDRFYQTHLPEEGKDNNRSNNDMDSI